MANRIKSIHSSAKEAAKEYLKLEWMPIPIRLGKKPSKGWPDVTYDTEGDVNSAFHRGIKNVGIVLGRSELIDIDLDWKISPKIAPHFLPETGAIFGREGKLRSHWIYQAKKFGKTVKIPPPFPTDDKEMIAEVRCGRHQTVFPGSTWEDEGRTEVIRWEGDSCEPFDADYDTLVVATRRLAAACYLSTHWTSGQRNDLALPLIGTLLGFDFSEDEIHNFISAIAIESGDQEVSSRLAAITTTVEKFEAEEAVTGLPTLCELITSENEDGQAHQKLRSWLTTQLKRPRPKGVKYPGSKRNNDDDDEDPKFKRWLLGKARGLVEEFWQSEDGGYYATIGPRIVDLAGEDGIHWLREIANESTQVGSRGAFRDVRDQLATNSRLGQKYPVYLRVAGSAEKREIYIDIADEARNVIIITQDGWSISNESPVRFFRPANMKPLPHPGKAGNLAELAKFFNLTASEDFSLLLAWVFGTYNPWIQYALINLNGEQGTGKSTATELLRKLTDPSQQPLKAMPRNEEDLVVSAQNQHVVSVDNLSYMKGDLSDAFCRLATGGSLGKRTLYTDFGESVVSYRRPAIINGIGELPKRQDLMDRLFIISMKRLETYRSVNELHQQFDELLPGFLAAMFDAISKALKLEPEIVVEERVRLLDFYKWSLACFQGAGLDTSHLKQAFVVNEEHRLKDSVEADVFARYLLTLTHVAARMKGPLHQMQKAEQVVSGEDWPMRIRFGTASQMVQFIKDLALLGHPMPYDLPSNNRYLSEKLNRIKPGLRMFGLDIVSNRSAKGGLWVHWGIVDKKILQLPDEWADEIPFLKYFIQDIDAEEDAENAGNFDLNTMFNFSPVESDPNNSKKDPEVKQTFVATRPDKPPF